MLRASLSIPNVGLRGCGGQTHSVRGGNDGGNLGKCRVVLPIRGQRLRARETLVRTPSSPLVVSLCLKTDLGLLFERSRFGAVGIQRKDLVDRSKSRVVG